jgi:hypothetical protein
VRQPIRQRVEAAYQLPDLIWRCRNVDAGGCLRHGESSFDYRSIGNEALAELASVTMRAMPQLLRTIARTHELILVNPG